MEIIPISVFADYIQMVTENMVPALNGLIEQVKARDERIAEMQGILEVFVATEPYAYNDNNGRMECLYCHDSYGFTAGDNKQTKDHEQECIWRQAAALFPQSVEEQVV